MPNNGNVKRWSFLGRGDSSNSMTSSSSKVIGGSSSSPTHKNVNRNGNGVSPLNSRRRTDSSGRKTPNGAGDRASCASPRTEMVNGSLPPVGLNGPTAFQFSPPYDGTSVSERETTKDRIPKRQRYVSFLSSPQNIAGQNPTASGSPVRTIGGNNSSGEKRLFVMELEPIWDEIDRDDGLQQNRGREHDRNQHSNDRDDHNSDRDREREQVHSLHEPNTVMKDYVTPLLNTSLPFNRPRGSNSNDGNLFHSENGNGFSRSRETPNDSPVQNRNQLTSVADKSLSLEENLRRERQRLHSNGVTQFSWGSYKLPSDEIETKTSSDSMRPISASAASLTATSTTTSATYRSGRTRTSASKRPIPERMPSPHHRSPDKYGENEDGIRIVVPLRGNIYIQDGVGQGATCPLRLLYDKSMLEDDSYGGKKSKSKRDRRRKKNALDAAKDTGAIDPQLSPDGSMIAFVVDSEIYVMSCQDANLGDESEEDFKQGFSDMDFARTVTIDSTDSLLFNTSKPTRVTFGARSDEYADVDRGDIFDDEDDNMSASSSESTDCGHHAKKYGRSITHGLADFVAQEEMDRYQGFWWNEDSTGIIFARVDESFVPPYRITHQGTGSLGEESSYEEHRYPFAGKTNPLVTLGYVDIDRDVFNGPSSENDRDTVAKHTWSQVKWFQPPDDASEYLSRVNWLPDGSVCVQWQDRRQSTLLLERIDISSGKSMILHREESDIWINLHHMFKLLPRAIHPHECIESENDSDNEHSDLPEGSFSYVFVSERTGFNHLYLYTFIPGDISATLIRAISAGDWIVESIMGVDMDNDYIYFTGTHKSPLEKHLYALPIVNPSVWNGVIADENDGMTGVRRSLRNVMSSLGGGSKRRMKAYSSFIHPRPVSSASPPNPLRLTSETGMHSVTMDASCRIFVDTCSDIDRPTTTKIYSIPLRGPSIDNVRSVATDLKLRSVVYDATKDYDSSLSLNPPELLSFPTSDGTETLHAALYQPNPRLHGPGPYPLICAVYGGPHVQRVTRSWCMCADMRVQRLCSMGFAVVKCDNRGSSRRGLQFEGAIKKHLGRVEVLDQVTAVRYLVSKQIADPLRVGIHGWSYGGYLAAMCLCRAPDVFTVGIAGAPVTSWDGYDTHYTERYMGLPSENYGGYDESAVFEHIPNMRGKLLLIHGLIDENVHFRHTARLINHLVAAGKDYDLLIFPEERHSPRRLRDRIYMEKRMCDYYIKHLMNASRPTILGNL